MNKMLKELCVSMPREIPSSGSSNTIKRSEESERIREREERENRERREERKERKVKTVRRLVVLLKHPIVVVAFCFVALFLPKFAIPSIAKQICGTDHSTPATLINPTAHATKVGKR